MEIMKKSEIGLTNLNLYEESFFDYIDADDKTIRAYMVGIKAFNSFLQENNINNPTREDVISFRNMLREKYSSNTCNTYMIAVRALFKYLSIHGLYENIAVDLKGARYSSVPKKQVLSQEQAKKIYNGLTDLRERCLFSLLLSTGLRGIEVARAKIEDIQLHNNEVVLWIQCKKHSEKDEYVKLSPQVINDLKAYIGDRTSSYIFVSTSHNNTNGGMTTSSIRSIIKNIFRRYGLNEDTFSLHSMRRTSATIMYENGADIYSIQQVLHHANQSTTVRYINAVTRNNNKNEYLVSDAIFN